MSSTKANAFLKAMDPKPDKPAADEAPAAMASARPPKRAEAKPATGRAGLKHIGGYLDRETVEMVAVLRARLNLDNSELLKLAIEELHRKHEAKRAYGDT